MALMTRKEQWAAKDCNGRSFGHGTKQSARAGPARYVRRPTYVVSVRRPLQVKILQAAALPHFHAPCSKDVSSARLLLLALCT